MKHLFIMFTPPSPQEKKRFFVQIWILFQSICYKITNTESRSKEPKSEKRAGWGGGWGKGLGESGGGGEGGLVVSDFFRKDSKFKKHFCRGWGRGNLFFINSQRIQI